jgi:hypothetical protein
MGGSVYDAKRNDKQIFSLIFLSYRYLGKCRVATKPFRFFAPSGMRRMCTLGGAEQGRNTHWLLHFSNAVMCIFRRYPRAYLLYLLSDLLLSRLRESAIRCCIFVLAGFFRALFVLQRG